MASWLLDANVIIYLLTGHEDFTERIKALIRQAKEQNHALILTPVVIAEVLHVLEGEYFRLSSHEAAGLLEGFIRAPEVHCEDEESVLAGLVYHSVNQLDFVDGYLASRASKAGVALVTNDRNIGRRTSAQLVNW